VVETTAPARHHCSDVGDNSRVNPPHLVFTLARIAWLALLALTIGMLVAGVPAVYHQILAVCAGGTCYDWQLSPEAARRLEEGGIPVSAYATYFVVFDVLLSLTYCSVAALIFARASGEQVSLLTAFALVLFGSIGESATVQAAGLAYPALTWLVDHLSSLGRIAMLVLFYIFPDGRFVPGWLRWVALLLAATLVIEPLLAGSLLDVSTWPRPLSLIYTAGLFGGVVLAQAYRYMRVSSLTQRQQTKWVVFGLATGLAGFFAMELAFVQRQALHDLVPLLDPSAASYQLIVQGGLDLFLMLPPVALAMAILRYRLFDIDLLINRTLVYSTLTAGLGLTYWGGVILLQLLLRPLTQGSDLAIVGSTLAVAVLFQPTRRRIQAAVDRRFYRRKYDAAQTLEAFNARLQHDIDLDSLTAELLGVVQQTLQPARVSLWLRTPDRRSARGGLR
jgi:hypothetical protein